MRTLTHRLPALAAMAAFLSGCTGPVPYEYRAKWNCGMRETFGFDIVVTIDGSSISWPGTTHANPWTAKITGIQTPSDGPGVILQLAENPGPFGTVRLRPVADYLAIEGRRCRKT